MEEIKRPDIEFAKLENTVKTAEQCEKQVTAYKEWVETLDEPQLKEEEEKIIEIINEHEKVLKDTNYDLSKKVEFEGRIYTREKVFKFIQGFVNKRECNYQETLGLFQLYQYWGQDHDTVSYPILDSTLRTLESTPKFRGYAEWEKILVINEFFKSNNSKMTMDYLQQIYWAHIHNVLIDKLQLKSPVKQEEAVEGPIQMD